MKRIFTYPITPADAGQNITQFLKKQGFSRQNIVDLKKMPESILVNNIWKHVNDRLEASDILKICLEETESSPKILPVNLPLDIIYEDEDMLVINKPAGMPIHPSVNHYEHTLANAAAWYYRSRNIPFVFRCINRLDKDTSGLTIIAKHMVSAGILSQMTAERSLHRKYLAIVHDNHLPDSGTICAPIGRKENSTIERRVDFTHGDRAVTHYQVQQRRNGYALAALELETGRTHQIRVHMQYMNCPLVGDTLYNPAEIAYAASLSENETDMRILKRQALHSAQLDLKHPITKEAMHFTQELPKDMKEFLFRQGFLSYGNFS